MPVTEIIVSHLRGAVQHCHVMPKRASEAASVFVRKTDRFPLSGAGDVNTYALFEELFSN